MVQNSYAIITNGQHGNTSYRVALTNAFFCKGEKQMAKLNVPRPLCIADGCLRDFDKRSLCGKHYKFYREHGIELPPPLFRKHYCCIEDCDKDAYGHGYCHLHYKRLQSTGDPNLAQRNRGIGYTAVQRFWSRVALTANDEKCWLWTGSVNENGYGEVTADGYTFDSKGFQTSYRGSLKIWRRIKN